MEDYPSHANFHIHKGTHDNEYVQWEEEWLIINKMRFLNHVNQILNVVITFISVNTDTAKYAELRIIANG